MDSELETRIIISESELKEVYQKQNKQKKKIKINLIFMAIMLFIFIPNVLSNLSLIPVSQAYSIFTIVATFLGSLLFVILMLRK